MNRMKQIQFRRGSVLIYSFYMMIIMMVMVSVAMDFGRMQVIKTELQRSADATAHAALEMYISSSTNAIPSTPTLQTFATTSNPVDANSGISPTFKVSWGTWNTTTKKFSASTTNFASPPAGTQSAVQVLISRSAQNNNSVPLTFPLVSGSKWVHTNVDIWASSIAVLNPAHPVTETISAQWNPWLAGMPAGSTLSYGTSTPTNNLTDTEATDGPPLTMDVTPGTYVTFTGPTGTGPVTGSVDHDPTLGTDGPDGNQSWTHMQDSPDGNHVGEQNNIQTLTAPLDALVGVFLGGADGTAPTAANTPATANDYETQNDNQIQLQQPFYIGDGTPVSGGSAPAQFLVPPGATRLFLGTMDGYQWINNGGTFSATITQQPTISLVQ
jgi:Putative Flp pilus-assembly TadE/G-like